MAEEEVVIAEYGTAKIGKKSEVSEANPMKEGIIYEFFYNVYQLPIPLPGVDWFRTQILEIFMALEEQYTGLKIFYYKLTNKHFQFQAVGKSSSPLWKEIALSVLLIACQGIFVAAGVVIVLQWIKRVIPEPPPWWVWLLGGIGIVVTAYFIGYTKGRKK